MGINSKAVKILKKGFPNSKKNKDKKKKVTA